MPATVICLRRGTRGGGVSWPAGAISVTASPTPTPRSRASTLPNTTRNWPGTSRPSSRALLAARSVTAPSSAGSMPRTSAPFMSSPRASRAWAETKGAAPIPLTFCRACARLSPRSATPPPPPPRRPPGREDLDVRDHAEHAVAHILLKPVHHRQHNDQRRHPERNAEHRHARDERNEAVAPRGPAGPGIAPAQGQFIRNGGDLHGGKKQGLRAAGRGRLWHPAKYPDAGPLPCA